MGYGHTLLKQIRTWLNEEQYKAYIKNAKKMHMTEYAITKKLAIDFLEKRRAHNKTVLILYFFIIYSLATTGILLFF